MEKVVTNRSSSFVPQKTTFVPKKDLYEMEKERDNPLIGIQFDKRGSK